MAPMPRYARTIQVLLEAWNDEFGTLFDKAPSKLQSQKLQIRRENGNEGPHGISNQTHGLRGKLLSTEESQDDQSDSN